MPLSSVMVSAPARVPVAVGEKVTQIVQLPPIPPGAKLMPPSDSQSGFTGGILLLANRSCGRRSSSTPITWMPTTGARVTVRDEGFAGTQAAVTDRL